jgi:CHAT domain-containing protein
VDDAHPERSAIVLSPGGRGEDGLLQLREIVNLPLDRRVVILSGCRSASGTELEGEGVLGLARGFFQAGASAVVGTLWPVRDDEMEVFMTAFARELRRGRSLSAAHREAVRSAIRAGLPALAWAGTVILGDGDVTPVPTGGTSRLPVLAGAAVVCALGFAGWAIRVRRRRFGPNP